MATVVQNEQSRAKFLSHFRVHGNVSWACRVSGLSRTTLYDWLKATEPTDEQLAFQQAYAQAEIEATEYLEQEAWKRATGYKVLKVKTEIIRDRRGNAVLDLDTGKPRMVETERTETQEYSPTILMRLLAARAPEKYRERSDVQMSGKDGGPINLAFIDAIVAAADNPDDAKEGDAA